MVFAHLAVYILDKYLGDYIENLDSKQLKIDLWNGDVVLENLSLKPNAFAKFNLPVTIAAGYLHKLSLHVPWKHLYTHPTKITIDGFYLLLTPNTDVQYDPERDEQSQYESKMKEVYKVEQFRKEKEEYENSQTLVKDKDTFLERLQIHILRNLQLSISNIHIAYEDTITKREHPFSFGITLSYIKLFTTNTEWEPMESEEDSPMIYKFGELNTLSIYWNSNVKTRSELTQENIVDILQGDIDQRVSNQMIYILRPLNIQARLKIATAPSEQDYVRPVFDAKIDLEQISLNINRNQYGDLLDLLEFHDYLNLKSKYIKYYSMIENDTISKPSIRRWKFAYAAILHEEVRPRLSSYKWENIKTNLDQFREYHELYLQVLNGDASKKQQQRAQELEKKIDVFNLLYIRRTVEIEIKKKKAEHKPQSWWDMMTGWWTGHSNEKNQEFNLDSAMAVDEKKKLYDAIGYADENTILNYPEEYVDIDLSVQLKTLEVNVWSNTNESDSQFQVIASAAVPNIGLQLKRRPAKQAYLFVVDLTSFQVLGVTKTETMNDNRPVLAQNRTQLEQKSLLHIEYETNPLNKLSDNRIQVRMQPLEIIYDAFTINKLAECFQPDRKRDLQGIKEIAYSTFDDIKYRTHFLFNHYLKNIQASDIDIDLRPFYFLLPENGIYQPNCPIICLDFGHFTLKGGPSYTDQEAEEGKSSKDVSATNVTRQSPYFPLKLRWENIQLIYANQNDDWYKARIEQNSPLHLIKPITIYVDIHKCIYSENTELPAWKISAHILPLDGCLSDARIFGITKLIQSIPFPQSKKEEVETEIYIESTTFAVTVSHQNTKKTLEAVENMTPVQKILQEAYSAELEGKTDDETSEKENINSQDQLIELEITFELPRIDLLIEESISDELHDTQPFIRISIVSIVARATMKTFDIDFDITLADFIVIHEQFLTNTNDRLRLIATECHPLINIHGLLTSPVNSSFASAPYNGIENQIRVSIGKPILMLQLEALLTIVRFKNDLIEKIFKEQKHLPFKRSVNKRIPPKQVIKKGPSSTIPTFHFEGDLQGLRAIIGSESSQILDIQIGNLHVDVLNSKEKSTANFILTYFSVFDPNPKARFHKIISQQTNDKQLLHLNFSLINYPKKYEKTLADIDCDVKLQLIKINIIFLYKHMDLILNLMNMFQTKTTKRNTSLKQSETNPVSEIMGKFQEQARKLRLDVTLNAPSILIPINSYSNDGLFIDLGQLTIQTQFMNDFNQLLVEQHILTMKNFLISRVKLNNTNEIVSDINLLECTELSILIERLLYPDKTSDQSKISIKTYWDTIQFLLAKDDYECVMKVLKENFSEKIYHEIPKSTVIQDQSKSEQINQEIIIINNTKSDYQIIEQIRFNAKIKTITLTLYLGNSDVISRDEKLKFVDFKLEMFEADFCQLFDSSYHIRAQIQGLLSNDLRVTDGSNHITRLIDRGFKIDPKVPILAVTLEFKPKNEQRSMDVRQVNVQLESFYICISADYLMALQDFFISSLSATDEKRSQRPMIYPEAESDMNYNLPLPAKSISTYHRPSITTSPQRTSKVTASSSKSESNLQTLVDVVIKTPEIILLEDQYNINSNCLVLDVSSQIHMVIVDDTTKISGSLKDLTIYSSKFGELKNSKIGHRILQPVDIDATLMMNMEEQKIDIHIGDITVQIPPKVMHTIRNMINSIGKLQTTVQTEADIINSKTLFDPKPFKDANFWFIENNDTQQELMEQTDILEVTTGNPSKNKPAIEEARKEKEKEEQMQNIRFQELIVNLKIIEVKLELGPGSTTKPVLAMCLSDLSIEVKNWSSKMSLSSKIHVELALFNDNLLAWQPLIEPVIDDRGDVVCPWCITCSTSNHEDDDEENDEESRFLLEDSKSSSNSDQQEKEEKTSMDAKQVIHVRADHLLNITVTKTMLGIAQRLSSMFKEAFDQEVSSNEDENQPLLSVLNMTGDNIYIDHINGVQLLEDSQSKTPLRLKHEDSIPLTVSSERLSATRIPCISEQIANRKQEFSVKIGSDVKTVDINQTWRRVFDLGPSCIPNWPIQLLCDSQLYDDRRRIVLSSIIKIFNRATMPIMILDIDSVEMGTFREVTRIKAGEEIYLPLNLLYVRNTPRLFVSTDDAYSTNLGHDFISFDWAIESSADRILKMNNGKEAHFVFYKESKESYTENTDEPLRTSFHIYVKLALHLINLLSLDVQCWIDNVEQVELKPSHLYHSVSGSKKSVLTFMIPCYNDAKWLSEPVNLNRKSDSSHNDYVVIFHNVATQEAMRLVLRVDTYRQSYRASLYSPFWVVNCTDLKFEFKIENETTLIEIVEPPFFVCPKHFESNKKKKGHLRLFSTEQDETLSEWSEGFSLDVIKSTGMASCKVANDKTYMITIDIVTSSFGMTKILTIAPSTVVINKSTIKIEVTEAQSTKEEQWKSVEPEGIIPFWPCDIERGLMCVRYTHNRLATTTFKFNSKQRTLLRMNDEERPALESDIIATDFDGFRIVFGDYKINDSPVLLVNCMKNRPIAFCQVEDIRTQILPAQHYVYYTWFDPLKPQALIVSSNGPSVTIELNPLCGRLETNDQQTVYYTIFHDGIQTVLLFAEEINLIETVTNMPSLSEKMSQHIQISIRDIGIAVIDDIARNDLFYISISKSNEIWTETRKSYVKPLSSELNHHLDEHYKSYIKHLHGHSNDEELAKKKYHIDNHRDVSFDEDTAEVSDHQGHRVHIQRQALDGFWVGFAWSKSNQALHLRINGIQIDNEHEYTLFPVVLNPIVSKASGTDMPGKPFIELSVFKTAQARANTQHFKYLKLLVQEFVFCADQTLIMAILTFAKSEKVEGAPTINMEADLKRIDKPLKAITEAQSTSLPAEPKILFDNLHLSPIKVHVSFSMHGSSGNDQLLAEYPLVDFLLQTLNVAEVQDVILKLNCYERKNEQFTIAKLAEEIQNHFQNQLMRQLHVVVLGLDVLGNPFGVISGVAEGVESFFYEPYKGAMEGPVEFIEGIAVGARHLVGSTVGGAAGAVSKITGVASKGLATLTFDKEYQYARIARKEVSGHTVSDVILSGKNIGKDIVHGMKGVVQKPIAGAKKRGTAGFMKGLGKGFLGLVTRPASGVADFTSTSLDLIKRVAVHEGVVHRVRSPRHVGRDGIIRPSTAHETKGFDIFDKVNDEKHSQTDGYMAHIECVEDSSTLLLATTKRLFILTGKCDSSDVYEIEWYCHYKDLKGSPVVKFEPDEIEIILKEPKVLGLVKKDRPHEKTVPYQNTGEARYIVDKITQLMRAMEL